MGARSKIWLLALLLAFGSCSYHHFSKSRFLKECDIRPDQMALTPQKEKEEVAAGHFHSAGGQALLERFQSKHKMSDCQELLRGYGQGFFLWEYGRGADSLLADHLLSWGIRHSQKTEDVINYALKYAFCQPTERKIAITRVCSDYLELVSDSLAYQILYNLSEALNRPKDVDYQEVFSVEQKRLKYTMSLYGTESDIFLNNLSDCAHSALFADHPEWPMWADSLYRYHKDRAIHYKNGLIYSLDGDPLYARFKQLVIGRQQVEYARELLDYLTNAVHPIQWERHNVRLPSTDHYISSALFLLNLQYWVSENEKKVKFWLDEIGATVDQFIGPPGYGMTLMGCMFPDYELHPDIAMLVSTFYRHEDLAKVYDMALKVKGFTDDFSSRMLRMVNEYGTPELKEYVDSVRWDYAKNDAKKFDLAQLFQSGELRKIAWCDNELKRLYEEHPVPVSPRVEDVRRALGPNEVAVEIVNLNNEPLGNSFYIGLVLIPDKSSLGAFGLINHSDLIIRSTQSGSVYQAESVLSDLTDVMKPYLEGKTVYFSSTGFLDLINIAALCCKDGRRIQDICHFVPVYSTKSLCEKKHAGPYSSIALFNGSSDLMGARREIEQIGRLARNASVETVAYYPVAAIRNGVQELSGNSPQIIHIAAHGIYHGPDEDAQNYLSGVWENCGLRFADGMLSAMDIARMNLVGTDLVVLSACNSGLGELSNEGLTGLRRAFRRAGVKSLLMTLDRVDDEASRFFMEAFYHHLFSGKTKREAFDAAVDAMRRSERYSAPEYWAPFILLE